MIERSFIPGSEWIYMKLYTGTRTSEIILTELVLPFLEELQSGKYIKTYYFIRYADPGYHIRLRLNLAGQSFLGEVLGLFYKAAYPFKSRGLITDISFDTYNRELERYGENTIEITENIFRTDSEAVLGILDYLNNGEPENDPDRLRWMISVRLIDDLLDAFKYSPEEKREIIGIMSADFKNEFGFTRTVYTRQLNDKYRENKKFMEQIPDLFRTGITGRITDIRKKMLEKQAEQILNIRTLGYFQPDFRSYIASLIHMTMNRLFRTRNRLCEMVIYDFLYRYYKSRIARNGQRTRTVLPGGPQAPRDCKEF